MSELVWYAAYGSNMSRKRFDIYLRGGTPPGAKRPYPGCRNQADPVEDRPVVIEPALAFGGTSQTWGGGVAFVDAGERESTKARLYLLARDQLEDVLAQENWLEPGSIDLDSFDGLGHTYGLVLDLGTFENRRLMTFTQHRGTAVAPPSAAYLRHIADGLRDAHGMPDEAIVDYLITKPGVEGAFSGSELNVVLVQG